MSGGLTAKIPKTEDVQKMMLLKATEKTNLPLAFETIIGAGTKKMKYTMLLQIGLVTYPAMLPP